MKGQKNRIFQSTTLFIFLIKRRHFWRIGGMENGRRDVIFVRGKKVWLDEQKEMKLIYDISLKCGEWVVLRCVVMNGTKRQKKPNYSFVVFQSPNSTISAHNAYIFLFILFPRACVCLPHAFLQSHQHIGPHVGPISQYDKTLHSH